MIKELKKLIIKLYNYGYAILYDGNDNLEIVNQMNLYYAMHPELNKYHIVVASINVDYQYYSLNTVGATQIFQKLPFRIIWALNNFIKTLHTKKAKKYFEFKCNYTKPTNLTTIKKVSISNLQEQKGLYKQIDLSNKRQNIHNFKKLLLLVKDNLVMLSKKTNNLPRFIGRKGLIKLLKANIEDYLRLNDFSNIIRIAYMIQDIQDNNLNNYLVGRSSFYKVNSKSIENLLYKLKSLIKKDY